MRGLRSLLASPFGGALAGTLAIAAIELAVLGGAAATFDLGGPVLTLFAALGFAIGAFVWVTEAASDRLRLPIPASALLRAIPALPPFVWLAGGLFQGATAATLPGAGLAHVWVPAGGVLLVAAAIAVGQLLVSRAGAAGRAIVAFLCLAAAAGVELADRRFYPSEYPDVHAFLVPAACVLAATGLRVALGGDRSTPRRGQAAAVIAWSISAALVVLGGTLSLFGGLDDQESRWAIATRGSHARHMVRVVRGRFDGDGDGFARVLGGGDCNDGVAVINPGAAEVAANQVDEDCDGSDLVATAVRPATSAEEARARALTEFNGSPARTDLLARAARWNILVISVDALRADAVADDPTNRKDFPGLFRLLDGARRFDRAFAPSAGTDLSVSSVVTGRVNPFQKLDLTVIESLSRAGRATHAILPREVLRYAGATLLTRGLDSHDSIVNDKEKRDVSSTTSSKEVTAKGLAALGRLAAAERPFFLWLHYFDAHEHLQIEASDELLAKVASEGHFDLTTRRGKYRALVAVIDREVTRVLDEVDKRGLADRTVVVFFSDHGESLKEDPRLPDNHGLYVYQPLVHVPLALRIPGGPTGPVTEPITLLDLPPTLIELAGAVTPPELAGRSLVPHLIAGAPAELFADSRPLVLNESDQFGVVLWPKKLLVRPADNLVELYDVERDPLEKDNLAERDPESVRALKAMYQTFPPVSLDRTRKGREMRERLAQPPPRR